MLVILFTIGFLSGGFFLKRYVFKVGFFTASAIFLGAYSLVLFYLMILGARLNQVIVLFPLLFLPFALYEIIKVVRQKFRWRGGDIRTYLIFSMLVIIIIFCAFHVLNRPITERDGLGIWLTKAKMIYQDRTLGTENFFNAYRIHDHPRYPLLWPIIEAAYFFTGGMNERTVKLMTLFIWLLIIGILAQTSFRRSNVSVILLLFSFILIPAYYVMVDGSLDTGYADIPLSLFALCAYVCLYNYLMGGQIKYLAGAGLSLSFCMFTKDEGIAITLSALVMFFFIKKRNRDILWLLAFSIIPVLPWFLTRMRITDFYAEHYLAQFPNFFARLDRIPLILKNIFFELINLKHWGIFWVIIAGCVILAIKTGHAIQLLMINGMLFIVYFGIFILTPWDLDLQMRVVFPRMLLHVAPAMVFLVCQMPFERIFSHPGTRSASKI